MGNRWVAAVADPGGSMGSKERSLNSRKNKHSLVKSSGEN